MGEELKPTLGGETSHIPAASDSGPEIEVHTEIVSQRRVSQENPPSLEDQKINQYLSLTPEEQVNRWTTPEFVSELPGMVRRLLSPEGLAMHPMTTRTQIYDASI